jgi:hypothetical protein
MKTGGLQSIPPPSLRSASPAWPPISFDS